MAKENLIINVFPNIVSGNNKSEFHLPRLLNELKLQNIASSIYINSNDLKRLSKRKTLTGEIFFLNWLDTLYLSYLNKYLAFLLSFLPDIFRKIIVAFISIKIESLFLDIIAKGGKIIFYYHDLNSFSRLKIIKEIDNKIRPFIYYISATNLFAEKSACTLIESILGKKSFNLVCQIGSYAEFHGDLLDCQIVRKKYNIPSESTVIVSIGTIRSNRSIDEFYDFFAQEDDLFFLAAGRGNKKYLSKNIIVFDDYIENHIMIELLSCSNYLLHTGVHYLTSAAVRVAISYGLPVIARPFGSTVDMCSGALIELKEPLNEVLNTLPRKDSNLYFDLQQKASLANSNKTWYNAGLQFSKALNMIK